MILTSTLCWVEVLPIQVTLVELLRVLFTLQLEAELKPELDPEKLFFLSALRL